MLMIWAWLALLLAPVSVSTPHYYGGGEIVNQVAPSVASTHPGTVHSGHRRQILWHVGHAKPY